MEPPGTAPGSEPIITGAFIAIVGVAPDKDQYRGRGRGVQGWVSTVDKGGSGREINGLVVGVKCLLGSGSWPGFGVWDGVDWGRWPPEGLSALAWPEGGLPPVVDCDVRTHKKDRV